MIQVARVHQNQQSNNKEDVQDIPTEKPQQSAEVTAAAQELLDDIEDILDEVSAEEEEAASTETNAQALWLCPCGKTAGTCTNPVVKGLRDAGVVPPDVR